MAVRSKPTVATSVSVRVNTNIITCFFSHCGIVLFDNEILIFVLKLVQQKEYFSLAGFL